MDTQKPLYQVLARTLAWNPPAGEWATRKAERLRALIDELPGGSGINSGVTLDDDSTSERIKLSLSFHHMNDGGMYDGWTEHTVTVRPSLANGFDLKISGRDRNQVKDYLHECFDCALRAMVPEYAAVAAG